MKRSYIIAAAATLMIALSSCGGKSEVNKDQIEEAREEAIEMTSGYDATKSMKPTDGAPSAATQTPESEQVSPEGK